MIKVLPFLFQLAIAIIDHWPSKRSNSLGGDSIRGRGFCLVP